MTKSAAILQSNYIPWKGYFDLINRVDFFVLYDDCQYTKNDWRNRNIIKTAQGLKWITLPVKHDSLEQKINETLVADNRWRRKHWATLTQNYSKSRYFKDYRDQLEPLYLDSDSLLLSEINEGFIRAICEILGISTTILQSGELELKGDRTERLLGICDQLGVSRYYSGPAAKVYFDEELAESRGIEVSWMDYSGYPEYEQLYPPFEHGVSVLDLIFNMGPDSKHYFRSRMEE